MSHPTRGRRSGQRSVTRQAATSGYALRANPTYALSFGRAASEAAVKSQPNSITLRSAA